MQVFDNLEQKLNQIRTAPFYRPYIEELKAAYEADKNADIVLDYDSFMCFFTTGSRLEYESKYFTRNRKLTEALMLYLIYEEQEYLDALCSIIWEICGQITWVLPAHLPEVEYYRTHIDLFAAEMANFLAEADYLMGDRLPKRIRELIRREVKERIFDPFESRLFFWEKLETNWSGVCGGNVGMAYMYLAPERFEKVKDRLLDAMDCFLKSYGEDGSNTEGILYWQYGFWNYLNFADILYRYSEGKIDLLHGEKLEKMARFPQKLAMKGKNVVSFSDSGRTFGFDDIGLFCYLAKNYEGVRVYMPASRKIYSTKPTWAVRNFLWSDPEFFVSDNEQKEGMEYLEDAQWYMVQNEKYSFAAKGGHNNEGHNHNDVGSFILATDSGQMLADLGQMEYTSITFSEYRYNLLQNSSLGHSVPIIDGKAQGAGPNYRANVREVNDTTFAFELQNAYETDISKITRTFEMRDTGITLTDVYEEIEGHELTERFISVVKPELMDSKVRIGDVILSTATLPEIKKEVLRNHKGIEEELWFIDYKVTDKIFTLKIEVEG